MEGDRLSHARHWDVLLTFVSFEPMEAGLPDDIHPVHYDVNPNCATGSKL